MTQTKHSNTGTKTTDKILTSIKTALRRLTPVNQVRNPVMFVIYVSAILTTLDFLVNFGGPNTTFTALVALTIWFTVLFANFAEAFAEERGKAQASSMKHARQDISAKLLTRIEDTTTFKLTPAQNLKIDDLILIQTGDYVPADGMVVKGIATVDESAITGESAPVIRESGGDRDAVTGGTRVLSDWIIVKITTNPGESYLDKMIAMVEGAKRQKTPNEVALSLLLSTMTIIFVISCATLLPFSLYTTSRTGIGQPLDIVVLISLFVCIAPTTISGLLSAIGIAGMNRLMSANVIASSGRAVEAAGDVNVLLLDKTGTITLGNRQAVAFISAAGVSPIQLVKAALLASLADETPEGKSIVELANKQYNVEPPIAEPNTTFIPFAADTRISGIAIGNRAILKGAGDAIKDHVQKLGGTIPDDMNRAIEMIARQGGTPLMVAENASILGVIQLKDIVKTGIKERLVSLRAMGIKSVMVTGDNPLTAAAIAAEAGVDDFIAQATPETKLNYIRKMQESGELVAMVGDGTNDAPALAQADVAVAMNSGTQAAKEAANMIDLDSNPTKLIEVVEIGKQLLMTRGSLTTFSLANDIAKYFAILPAVFVGTNPGMAQLNVMGLSNPHNAILSSLIFNALIIIILIPLAMRGVTYRPIGADRLLRRNLLVYGLGGIIVPFIGIKAIDTLLSLIMGIYSL
ncbi:MAG: potassium-transporting ATPase subunit KdpB [Alphaproteobacteria bacterium]|nr:potassium-transporting ATPase subunit KdpB [Alphaproteobacteria bacterium]